MHRMAAHLELKPQDAEIGTRERLVAGLGDQCRIGQERLSRLSHSDPRWQSLQVLQLGAVCLGFQAGQGRFFLRQVAKLVAKLVLCHSAVADVSAAPGSSGLVARGLSVLPQSAWVGRELLRIGRRVAHRSWIGAVIVIALLPGVT